MNRYTALLRAINVTNRRVKMDALRATFANLGFPDAQTILASGNVVFSSPQSDPSKLQQMLELGLETEFGFAIPALLRSQSQIEALIGADPIGDSKPNKETKFHVSFLDQILPANIELPHISSDPDFEVHEIDELHLFNIVRLGPSTGTVNLMDWLTSHFGNRVTTRTWNTLLKIQSKLAAL
jgi:uncharacterized protein (DUF1697 family)